MSFLVITYARIILCALHSLQASFASVALLRLLFQFYVAVELAYASTWALLNLLEFDGMLDRIDPTPRFRHFRYVDDDNLMQSKTRVEMCEAKCQDFGAKPRALALTSETLPQCGSRR